MVVAAAVGVAVGVAVVVVVVVVAAVAAVVVGKPKDAKVTQPSHWPMKARFLVFRAEYGTKTCSGPFSLEKRSVGSIRFHVSALTV